MTTPVSPNFSLDVNGAPYHPDLSPFLPQDVKPEPEAGHFILPQNAEHKDGDRFHNGEWNAEYSRDGSCGNEAKRFPWLGGYSRPIANDPELHAKMQEYAEKYGRKSDPVAELDHKIAEANSRADAVAAELKKLEEQKKGLTEIKVGDWVVIKKHESTSALPEGSLWKVIKESTEGGLCEGTRRCVNVKNELGIEESCHITRLRKATPAEISTHLANVARLEAEKKRAEEEAAKKVVVHSDDGRDYTAEYFPGYVQFGCAKIGNSLILDSHSYLFALSTKGDGLLGNRHVESIKIGRGTFTLEILWKLVKNLKN